MKQYLIFLFFLMIGSCSIKKQYPTTSMLARIDQKKIYFSDGGSKALPAANQSKSSTIFLVRHAEKMAVGGRDPLLTKEGMVRAERLGDILNNAGIDEVYATDYKRTQLTAKPTANTIGKKIKSYSPNNLEDFARLLKTKYEGKEVLVVGHSNTTPNLVNALLNEEKYQEIDEQDYGNFFIVTISSKGKETAMKLRY